MREIKNRQELNQYYSTVDLKLKEYIDKYKVNPNELKTFVKNNMEDFKEESGLLDVVGIEKVILDILDHYNHSHLDKLLTFESFSRHFY